MPMIDFRCECGFQFEHFYHPTQSGTIESEPCGECGKTAPRIYEYRRPHSYTGLTESAVLYKSLEDGHYYVPAAKDAPMPAGFERVELRSAAEVRRVEREMTEHEHRKWQQSGEREEIMFSEERAANRKELLRRMDHMSAAGRDLARAAIEKENQRASRKFRGEIHFEAFSQDSSNRGAHVDERTDWKRIKR